MANFYRAIEDDQKYDDVCDIRRKVNRTNSNVLEAFSGLECHGKELYEWESSSKVYRDKFKKAKQCVQRRLTTMKRFSARSAANKTSRRKHIYPIQVAYAYGKDCLKKFATKKDQEKFRNSVNDLISKITETQPNISSYFEGSIEGSIRNRENAIVVQNILNREYYNDDRSKLIEIVREVGYNNLDEETRERYLSMLNEGFTRNTAEESDTDSESDSDTDSDTDNNNENNKRIKVIKKELKKRKAIPKSINTVKESVTFNITDLDALLQTNQFRITNEDKRKEMVKRIKEIAKLYADFLLLRTRLFLIEDIYKETFTNPDKLNVEVMSKISGLSGQPITKRTVKKEKIDAKYTDRLTAFNKRSKLGDNFLKLHSKLKEKFDEIAPTINSKLKTGDKQIDISLKGFYDKSLPTYLVNSVDRDLDSMNEADVNKYLNDRSELYGQRDAIRTINKEMIEMEQSMSNIQQRIQTLQRMLDNPGLASRKNVFESTKKRLEDLKTEEATLERVYLTKYNAKTNAIQDMLVELNKKYYNPYILQELLDEIIRMEAGSKK